MIKPYIGPHIKHPLFLADLNEALIFRRVFDQFSITKFYENPSSGSRIVPCGQTDRQTRENQQSLFAILRKLLKTKTLGKIFTIK